MPYNMEAWAWDQVIDELLEHEVNESLFEMADAKKTFRMKKSAFVRLQPRIDTLIFELRQAGVYDWETALRMFNRLKLFNPTRDPRCLKQFWGRVHKADREARLTAACFLREMAIKE